MIGASREQGAVIAAGNGWSSDNGDAQSHSHRGITAAAAAAAEQQWQQ